MKLQRQWLVPIGLMLVGLAFGLTGYPLLDPDEGRNAEVAREMAASNNYVLPHLNELPYLDKPVVFFSATAASMEVFGPTVFAARLVPLLFTLLTIGVIWWFANQLFGAPGGLLAAVATGTMPLTLAFARTVIFDSALTLFVTGALVSFYMGITSDDTNEGAQSAPWWIPAAFGCIGLGILTKGPIAFVIPMIVVLPFSLWCRRGKRLLDPIGWLLLVAVVLPWVAAVSRDVPDFIRYVVYTESVGRLFTDELRRTGPFWYFFPIFISGALPWSLVALFGWKRFDMDRRVVFCLLWIALPLIFFSLSQSKRPQYVLPLMPPIGLLVARLWSDAPNRLPGARATALALVPIAVVLGAASLIVPTLLDVSPSIAQAIPTTASVLAVTTAVTAIGVWIWPHRLMTVVTLLCLPAAAIAIGSPRLMQAIGEDRSAYHGAEAVRRVMNASTEIVAVNVYPLSLPFYLKKTFTLSTTNGSELTSNYLVRSLDRFRVVPGTPIRSADWWLDALANCNTPRIFLVAKDDQRARTLLADRLPLIVEMKRSVAYGPCATTALARIHHEVALHNITD